MNHPSKKPSLTSTTESEETLKIADIFITSYVTGKDHILHRHTKNPLNFFIHASIFTVLSLLAEGMIILAQNTYAYNAIYYLGDKGVGDEYAIRPYAFVCVIMNASLLINIPHRTRLIGSTMAVAIGVL
jgi:hypothetical protein